MTYRPIIRRLCQMVQAHGQGFVLGVGKQVDFGVVNLKKQSPCILCPTIGTMP
jgi:GH25 family lysozyme M1 (1,4-beta-N-acetylmuramidase)